MFTPRAAAQSIENKRPHQPRPRSAETSVLLSNREANLPPASFKCAQSVPSELLVSRTNNTRSLERLALLGRFFPQTRMTAPANSHSDAASQARPRSASAPLQIGPTSQASSFVAHLRPANKAGQACAGPPGPALRATESVYSGKIMWHCALVSPDFSSNLPAERGQAADNKRNRPPTMAGGRKTVCKCDEGAYPAVIRCFFLPAWPSELMRFATGAPS
jgi:hypothetical protein